MPAKAASLKITDSYRRRMVGIRNRGKAEARRAWSKVKLSNLDATYEPGLLTVAISQLQREAAQLSAGYLGAFISSETGEAIPLPPANASKVGDSRAGDLRKALDEPLIEVKVGIGNGMDPLQALHKGGTRLVRIVSLATDESAREALRVGMEHAPQVEGYQRAVKGTCGACAGMADGSTLPEGTPLEIHPDCQCVAEPVVKREPTWVKNVRARVSAARDPGGFAKADAMHEFDQPSGYALMQRILRNPSSVEINAASQKAAEHVCWLERRIAESGKAPVTAKPLGRATGMDHLPDDVLNRLDAGETVTIREDGFFAATDHMGYAQSIAAQTSGGKEFFTWRLKTAEKATLSPSGSFDEFVFPPGCRLRITKIKPKLEDWDYDVEVLGPDG